MATLYRKYRPQTFGDVIGQNHIKITLQNEIERGEMGHAYLFCGPRGLGKTTLARLFAKAVNCENRKDGESEPCDKCASCEAIKSGSNIDVIEIDAASHTGVENVRENIIENSRFSPHNNKYKVFIIDEVHMLSIQAFNALLKTLEEPPSNTIFILATTEIHKLPQTIISRCQRFDLKKVSAQDLFQRLQHIVKSEGKKVSDEVLKNVVIHSEGCVRDAESLLGKLLTLGDDIDQAQAELVLPRSDFKIVIAFTRYLLEKNTTAAIEVINGLIEDGVELSRFVEDLLEFWRKLLLIKVNGNLSDFGIELDEESQKSAESLATRFNYEQLLSIIDLFMEKGQELKSSLIQQLPLEMAIVQVSEEIVCKTEEKNDDDSDSTGGSGAGGNIKKVKEKIKDKITHIQIKRHKGPEMSLSNTKTEVKAKEDVKVDMSSSDDKLKPKVFVDCKKVEDKWQCIVETVLEKNYTVSSLLKLSRPIKSKDGVLEIAVANSFYCSRLEETKNKQMVEEVISEILQADVIIKAVVDGNFQPIVLADPESPKIHEKNIGSQPSIPKGPVDAVQDVMGMF